jgi:hypothetical protein
VRKKSDGGYLKLLIYSNWGDFFFLVPPVKKVKIELNTPSFDQYPRLCSSKHYDIKLPDGRLFLGCKIEVKTHTSHGMGGMSENSSSSEAFFISDGLTIKLESGFLMRLNKSVTAREQARQRRKGYEEELQKLNKQKADLEARISKISGLLKPIRTCERRLT